MALKASKQKAKNNVSLKVRYLIPEQPHNTNTLMRPLLKWWYLAKTAKILMALKGLRQNKRQK